MAAIILNNRLKILPICTNLVFHDIYILLCYALQKVEDTIKVIVPEEKGVRKLREYTFAQLKDLQSRLMLVAGKAESGVDNVERFTMVRFIRFSSSELLVFLALLVVFSLASGKL